MNSPITFPAPAPVLKLARPSAEKWAATVAAERRRMQEDHDALRHREANLREYEARLRALQAEIEAGRGGAAAVAQAPIGSARASAIPFQRPTSLAPFGEDPALNSAWEKLHRARELLEVEQTHMRDERVMIRDHEESLKKREADLASREAKLQEREALVAAAQPIASEHTMSAMTRLTTAPFKMFRGKKKR